MPDLAEYCAPVLRRPLCCLTLLWIGGILLAVHVSLPWSGWLMIAAAFLLLLWGLAGPARRMAVIALALAVVALATALSARLLAPPAPGDARYLPPGGVALEGYPLEPAYKMFDGWRLRFRVTGWRRDVFRQPHAGIVELHGREDPPVPGWQYAVLGRVDVEEAPGNPYGFSRDTYRAQHGMTYGVQAYQTRRLPRVAPRARTDLLRARLAQMLARRMSGEYAPLYSQLLNGLVLGLHGAPLPPQLVAQFRRAGTIHLMVVSGSQITLLSAVLLFPLWFAGYGRRRTSYPRARMLLLLLSLPILGLYVVLADRGPSVDRALLMVLLGSLSLFLAFSPLARRRSYRPDSLTLLAAAALVMLIPQPALLFSPSLQLSFAAVFGLITVTPVLMRLFLRVLQPIALLPAATLGAQLMTYPVLAWHFGAIPVLGAVTNLVAIPAVGIILPIGLLMLLFLPWCPVVTQALGILITPLISLLLAVSAAAARVPWAEIRWVVRSPWMILGYLAVLGMLLMLLARRLHRTEEQWKIPAGREPRMW
ncbi:MAG: ComEC/Rec2 family competence protein [Armatimonadota bacterium]